jgi:hypothetical protein
MMLSFYQCYHILIAAKKGLNVGNIIYGHKKFFPAKIHSLMLGCYQYIISNHYNNMSYESNYSKFEHTTYEFYIFLGFNHFQ